jgi:hypothetical protein
VDKEENVLMHKEIFYRERVDVPNQALLAAWPLFDTLSPDDTDRQFLLFSDPCIPPVSPLPPTPFVKERKSVRSI